jgi:hypothetical protein
VQQLAHLRPLARCKACQRGEVASAVALTPRLRCSFRENEVIHGRWAMLGAAGMLAVELAGQGNWIDAQAWPLAGGSPTYLGNSVGVSDLGLNVIILLAGVGFVDKQRTAESGEKRLYPGGSFDPLGYANDKSKLAELQLKEIKNGACPRYRYRSLLARADASALFITLLAGRLAMIACMGFFAQGAVTHDGPVAALGKHLANPWGYNVATVRCASQCGVSGSIELTRPARLQSNSVAIPPFHAADFAMGNNAFWEAAVPSFLL